MEFLGLELDPEAYQYAYGGLGCHRLLGFAG